MPNPLENETGITKDFFYKRKVIVYQRKKGYRFSVDAPILADFLPKEPAAEALEVGTGSGIISLLALYKKKFAQIHGLEIQPGLSQLAELNAEKNGFSRYLHISTGDFKTVSREYQGIRHIFSNPPYYEITRGRLSPNHEIRHAKAETRLTLSQLLQTAKRILGEQGSLYLVLPFDRYAHLNALIPETGFFVSRFRRVFSFKDGKEERFLIQLTNYDVSPEEMPPLIIFKEKGVYTDEMDTILTGNGE
jgi:tRNA1Val (adenine37-N6)-methyltransferase